MSEKKLKTLDDLFNDKDYSKTSTKPKQMELEISKLVPFTNHPFKLYEGQRLDHMVTSIKERGILQPIIVRATDSTTFAILSGHNRTNAAKIAGLTTVPVIIKEDLTDDEALLIVTETNLIQRSFTDLLHSERAKVLAEHHKAIKCQGRRSDLIEELEKLLKADKINDDSTSSPVGHRKKSIEKVGDKYNLSKNSVARYIRINELQQTLKERIDIEEIPLRAGVDLSYITSEEQLLIAELIETNNFKIDMKKSILIRSYSKSSQLNEQTAYSILSGKYNESDKKPKGIKLNHKLISKYFNQNQKQHEIEQIIEVALKRYFQQQSSTPITQKLLNNLNEI